MILEWSELESAAKEAFDWRDGQSGLDWGREVWSLLEKAGLTTWDGEIERHEVVFRFLALGGIHRDFRFHVWGGEPEREYAYWAEPLDLDPFIIGQLHGCQPDPILTEDASEALEWLVESYRPGVVRALTQEVGG